MSPTTTNVRRTTGARTVADHDERDRSELWTTWEEHHARLRRIVARRAGRRPDDHEVHDAASDALMRLGRTRAAGREVPDPLAWLALVAWREFLRRSGREGRRRQIETLTFRRTERIADAVRPDEVALDRARQQSQRHALDLALRTLPAGQRESLVLLADGVSYEEIAVARKTTVRAAGRALVKARRRLRSNGHLVREVRAWDA